MLVPGAAAFPRFSTNEPSRTLRTLLYLQSRLGVKPWASPNPNSLSLSLSLPFHFLNVDTRHPLAIAIAIASPRLLPLHSTLLAVRFFSASHTTFPREISSAPHMTHCYGHHLATYTYRLHLPDSVSTCLR